MNIVQFDLTAVPTNSHIARLARVLAERLDPADEYDFDVSITTVSSDEIDAHPAKDIPMGGYEYRYEDVGLEITLAVEPDSEFRTTTVGRLIRDYSDATTLEHGISHLGSLRGNTSRSLAFVIIDSEFTCGVTTPSWV